MKIFIIILSIILLSCNNKDSNNKKTPQNILTIKPFKDKLVYKKVKNKVSFINLLDNKSKLITKIYYPNKILSNIIYTNDKYYFLEENKLININPQNGSIYKVSDIPSASHINVVKDKILILTDKFCNIDKDLGTTLLVFKNDKNYKKICIKASITRLYLQDNMIYYVGFTNKHKNSIYSFDVKTLKNDKIISKNDKIVPVIFNKKNELYYYVFGKNKALYHYNITNKNEKKLNTNYLNNSNNYHSILTGFYSNEKYYSYVAIWDKNRQIDGYWGIFNKDFTSLVNKLKFKKFSYDIKLLNNDVAIVGNNIFNLK